MATLQHSTFFLTSPFLFPSHRNIVEVACYIVLKFDIAGKKEEMPKLAQLLLIPNFYIRVLCFSGFRCLNCNEMNPARKLRPSAPRLETLSETATSSQASEIFGVLEGTETPRSLEAAPSSEVAQSSSLAGDTSETSEALENSSGNEGIYLPLSGIVTDL